MKAILTSLLVAAALTGSVLAAPAQEKCKGCCKCEACKCAPCACCKCETCKCAKYQAERLLKRAPRETGALFVWRVAAPMVGGLAASFTLFRLWECF